MESPEELAKFEVHAVAERKTWEIIKAFEAMLTLERGALEIELESFEDAPDYIKRWVKANMALLHVIKPNTREYPMTDVQWLEVLRSGVRGEI